MLAELDRERKSDVAQADDTNTTASHAQFHEFSVLF
jgi:hypothetical protein